LRVLILMAGDFLEPASLQTMFSQFTLRGLKSGKIIDGGSPDTMHAYAYLPDLGRAAEALVSLPDLPDFAEVPFGGHSFTARDVKDEVERQTGRSYRFGNFPWWQLRLAAPFLELAREVLEMRYLTEHPHWLDPRPMQALLPDFRMTPFAQVIAEHLAARLPQIHPATSHIAAAR
jgi:nucleoside-diphosphate-sugar epimerase